MSNEELLNEVLASDGPGSQLWRLFERLGIQHRPDCSCLLLADIMNELGPQGCKDNRDKLLKLAQDNQGEPRHAAQGRNGHGQAACQQVGCVHRPAAAGGEAGRKADAAGLAPGNTDQPVPPLQRGKRGSGNRGLPAVRSGAGAAQDAGLVL